MGILRTNDDMDNKILVKTGHYFTRSKIDEDKLIVANVVSNDFNDFVTILYMYLPGFSNSALVWKVIRYSL